MEFQTLLQYIKIIIFLLKNAPVSIREITEEHGMNYGALYNAFKNWVDAGILIREEVERKVLGGPHSKYLFSEKGKNKIKDFVEEIKELEF